MVDGSIVECGRGRRRYVVGEIRRALNAPECRVYDVLYIMGRGWCHDSVAGSRLDQWPGQSKPKTGAGSKRKAKATGQRQRAVKEERGRQRKGKEE